ncbi:multidrug transporter AcrB [Vibrio breoganii]|uniref:Multidrug transporter AcrB n=1 Tax=Vibrio breoganii TaxID=553239 RepID=A0AAN1CTJ7_9VIBR|nr:efflux RND transporter permease subunit [Vibrio breoganii]ANO34552.1 multidrug transporter AcrB [Vibrio breoganii]PMO35269.1 multidrug transporter AcrB [Vibrio breoganii]
MNIANLSIKNSVISWMFIVILAIGGISSFSNLGRLEDPAFTLKDAMVIATYPGATTLEVEEELTYPLEKAIRQLPYIDKITSTTSAGKTQIMVSMGMEYGPDELPQIWDEMRRKINDLSPSLPQGVQGISIMDDFGDVYGMSLLLTGDVYTYPELKRFADFLSRELELVDGVGKVMITGDQQEQIFVEMSTERLASLNLDYATVVGLLSQQNAVQPAGDVMISGLSLPLRPTGNLSSTEQLEDLVIHGRDTGKLIRLKDIADISRGIVEKPQNIVLYNGQPALNIGISFASGVNVVEIGEQVKQRLAELDKDTPAGMEINYFYDQSQEVANSVDGFIISLAQAVGIVIVVLLFAMGLRSGLIIGLVLLLTVFGTFILMDYNNIELHRISLGALIIALGMLVDNAIVVVEGILVGIRRGLSKTDAAIAIVKQTQWPLLGATVIAITAFAPIGLSEDATGEFMGSLFWVLCYSLFLSWVTALTITPFLAEKFLPNSKQETADDDELYKGAIFTVFRWSLKLALRFRWTTIVALVALLASAVFGFGYVKQQFFPVSNTPIFYANVWMPEGTDIRETTTVTNEIESYVRSLENVEYVTTTIGQGLQRYALTYQPEKSYESYAQLAIRADSLDNMFGLISTLDSELSKRFPVADFRLQVVEFGPAPASKIEARVVGPDTQQLKSIAADLEQIIAQDPGARNIRNNWREQTKTIVPEFNESKARRFGISKEDVSNMLNMAFGGSTIGVLRDGTKQLPIVTRLPDYERLDIETINLLKIWSPVLQTYVPIEQVIDGLNLDWEQSLIMRRDRKREISVLADHDILSDETPAVLFSRLRPMVEAYELPEGYSLEWGGEYESSKDAQEGLGAAMPMGYLMMFIITMLLFNSFRKPLVIWLTVPLSIVGVSYGLLATNLPFSFTALLGLLSLSGMILKNGIVLMDQINIDLASGKAPYVAILDSATSRVKPVSMAALTTILGLIPLVADPFFGSMAVTIMAGLGFSTVLTLIVVPLLFATLYNIKSA